MEFVKKLAHFVLPLLNWMVSANYALKAILLIMADA
jgi:hypothetical protein